MADAGRGNAYHVETADQAPGIFAQELEGLLAIAAQNVRITVAPSSFVRRVDLCSGVEHHQDGKTLTVTMGDLVSEDTRPLLVTFRTNAAEREGWVNLGSITVAYDDVVQGIRSTVLTHDLVLVAMAPGQVAAFPADAVVVKERLVLRAATVLQAAIAQADGGDVTGAIQRLTDFLAGLEVAASTDPEVQVVRRRIRDTLHEIEDRRFDKRTRKHMRYGSHGWSGVRGKSAT